MALTEHDVKVGLVTALFIGLAATIISALTRKEDIGKRYDR